MNQPLVSVIIPTFNSSQHIIECLQSVLEQTYSNIEIIIIDDGSIDNTIQKINKHIATITQNNTTIQILTQPNSGSAIARNLGMRNSAGKYIAFLDSDDVWLPEKLEEQVSFMENNPKYALCFTRFIIWHTSRGDCPKKKYNQKLTSHSGWILNELIKNSIVWTTTVMIRKDIIHDIGYFNSNFKKGQDYDYWIRIASNYMCHQLAEEHAAYRLHDNNITNQAHDVNYAELIFKQLLEDSNEILQQHSISTQTIKSALSNTCASHSYQHRISGTKHTSIISAIKSISYNPTNLIAWKCLVRAFLHNQGFKSLP